MTALLLPRCVGSENFGTRGPIEAFRRFRYLWQKAPSLLVGSGAQSERGGRGSLRRPYYGDDLFIESMFHNSLFFFQAAVFVDARGAR